MTEGITDALSLLEREQRDKKNDPTSWILSETWPEIEMIAKRIKAGIHEQEDLDRFDELTSLISSTKNKTARRVIKSWLDYSKAASYGMIVEKTGINKGNVRKVMNNLHTRGFCLKKRLDRFNGIEIRQLDKINKRTEVFHVNESLNEVYSSVFPYYKQLSDRIAVKSVDTKYSGCECPKCRKQYPITDKDSICIDCFDKHGKRVRLV